MAQFKAFAPGVQVIGSAVLAIVEAMGAFRSKALTILEESGLGDPKPDRWYPQQPWLDAFKKIAESIGPKTLFLIGSKMPENVRLPPEIDTVEKALATFDQGYHLNHRGGNIGSYQFEMKGERSAVLVCRNPYPCEFDHGFITAMARRVKSTARITHNDAAVCRKRGGDSCSYEIVW